MLFGVTLITHELVKQLQDLNEVIALSALLNEEKIKSKILERLKEIAFPKEIEFEDSDLTVLFESEVVDDDL